MPARSLSRRYRFARRHARDARFTFGTVKVGELAAFSSAVILALIAAAIGYEAVTRLFAPVAINFEQATWLAVAGLSVNLVSAWLLFGRTGILPAPSASGSKSMATG
jgi:Co/Zn/Cd efflux system component